MSKRETWEKLRAMTAVERLRVALKADEIRVTKFVHSGAGDWDCQGDVEELLEENERLRGLLEAQEKSRMSVEEWSQEKSRAIDRLTAQRDEALAAMNADTADVVLAKCVAESEVHRLEEENERLRADADRVAAACNVEMADLRTRWNAAEARIDAALAVAGEGGSYSKVERMVKALKGEK